MTRMRFSLGTLLPMLSLTLAAAGAQASTVHPFVGAPEDQALIDALRRNGLITEVRSEDGFGPACHPLIEQHLYVYIPRRKALHDQNQDQEIF